MKLNRFLVPGLLGAAALALVLRRLAVTAPAKPEVKRGGYDAIDAYIEQQMRSLNIPGVSLAIVEGDQIVHTRGFGVARPGGETPTSQTPFFIGSLTKSFTALAVMQLVEAGKIELDAPVQLYLPWFRVADPRASAVMTVRHLLNQTSGISVKPGLNNLGLIDDSPDAAERQARTLSTLKLKRPVGAKFEYSNANYNLLGLVIEAASGERYTDYIQRHIFAPLGMNHSYTSKAEARKAGLAVGYRHWFGIPIPAPDIRLPSGSMAGGLLISCAEDMAQYLIAHLNGGCLDGKQILSSAGVEELHRPAAEIIEMGRSFGHYAMGWIIDGDGEARIDSHSGTLPEFGAFMAILPGQRKGFALLWNANHAAIKITLDEFGLGAAQRLAGLTPTPFMFGALPWADRALPLIPLILVAEIAATLGFLRRWGHDPLSRPSRGRIWRQHILFPLIPNLLVSLTLLPLFGKLRDFVKLYMPDFAWIARIFGSLAVFWMFLRTGLVLRALRKS